MIGHTSVITRQRENHKRLTESEIAARRAKGLCFRREEKFSPGHRCKDRTLQVLTICDEENRGDLIEEEEEGRFHQD